MPKASCTPLSNFSGREKSRENQEFCSSTRPDKSPQPKPLHPNCPRCHRAATTREITINATSEELWEAVGDVEGFPKSHPTITSFTGVAEVGIRMEFRNEEGGSSISFNPTVLAADPGRELRWLGHVAFSGLMDGNHAFLLEPVAGGTKVTQTESFTGILGIFALLMMDLDASIEASNQALANFVETKIQ